MNRTSLSLLGLTLALPLAAQGLHVGPGGQPDPAPPTTQPILRPPLVHPPFSTALYIKSLDIQVRIADGVASTTLAQVFHNPGPQIAEGTWILPLPAGATADRFTMTMNGQQVSGEVLDAQRAREIYTGIVRRQRDPGLLEYLGNGCLQARVFPIPAHGDMKVEVRFRQVLPQSAGIHHWSFPLRSAHVHGRPAERIGLDVQIASKQAIKNVWSPTPGADVVRQGYDAARVSLELSGSQMAKRDLEVFYGLSDQAFGLDLLTWRRPDQPGYFMMMIAPKLEWDESKAMPKSVTFVLDTSGSMAENGKIGQAKGALRFFLNSLKAHDAFEVIPFATDAQPLFGKPQPANAENIARALRLADGLEARGGTNIEKALTSALGAPAPEQDRAFVRMTVFMTDGLPTVDTTDTKTLLGLIQKSSNTQGQRVFVFGVGHDVNTRLLDQIAEDSHGDRDYVRPDEDIEVKTGALFTKLSHPVMSKVRIDCDGIDGFDILPKTTPDLFKGTRLLLTGRYRGNGHHAIRLTGVVDGAEQTFVYEGTFPQQAGEHDFIPTLWAQRKVAVLLDNIRLNGQNEELVQEIRRLGAEHGIVTPYTSHLILEEGEKLARARGWDGREGRFFTQTPGAGQPAPEASRLRDELVRSGELDAAAPQDPFRSWGEETERAKSEAKKDLADMGSRADDKQTGAAAVDRSLKLHTLREGRALATGGGAANLVTHGIQGRTFHLIGGVWVDGAFNAAMQDRVEKVEAFSDAYLALLGQHPELAKVFAFSARILVVIGGKAIEVV